VDLLIDWTANHYLPLLFTPVIYPVDIAGFLEFAGAALALRLAHQRRIHWLSVGMLICFGLAPFLLLLKIV
jgi:hypothetical protein